MTRSWIIGMTHEGYGGICMKIVLLRHGRPLIADNMRLSAAEFGHWLGEYETAGIDDSSTPSRETCELARQCAMVVCSHLKRSIESANALGITSIGMKDSAFREIEMPYTQWTFPKLTPTAWSMIFRIFWILGYSQHAESFKQAKVRARTCAEKLEKIAREHHSVLYIGHEMLNWHMAKHLLRLGWTGPNCARQSYWEFGVYRFPMK